MYVSYESKGLSWGSLSNLLFVWILSLTVLMLQTTILPNIQYGDVVPLFGIDEIVIGLSMVKTMLKASEDPINVSLKSQLQFSVHNRLDWLLTTSMIWENVLSRRMADEMAKKKILKTCCLK